MKIHYFQHVDFEGLSLIEDWIKDRRYQLSATSFYEDYNIPNVNDYDALIIMGGPMSVHDEGIYPWIKVEKEHISKAIKAGKHILGVCLGAQLIADVLGAKITNAPTKEIGWFPIAWSDTAMGHKIISGLNSAMNVFHWHGEQFEIPKGAIHLASSNACETQAFLYNEKVLGLQFHLEMNEKSIDKIIANCGDEITIPSPTIQSEEMIKGKIANIAACKRTLYRLLDNWLS
jgi:GMP synthase-like glutamine amidotransferase